MGIAHRETAEMEYFYRDGWKFYSLFINKKSKNERFNLTMG